MRLDEDLVLRQTTPSGLVAVTADEAGRYTRFAISMQGLLVPGEHSKTTWQIGNDIAGNRNTACEALLADEKLSWLWFIDDDHVVKHDSIISLLNRDVEIVTPICLRRIQPFLPIPVVDGDFMDLTSYGKDELVKVELAGSSGMLIQRHVLETIEPPWFELGNGISEDVAFCRKATEAGFDIHVDLAVRLGHISTAVIWPAWQPEEERWLTGFTVADGLQLATELGKQEEPAAAE